MCMYRVWLLCAPLCNRRMLKHHICRHELQDRVSTLRYHKHLETNTVSQTSAMLTTSDPRNAPISSEPIAHVRFVQAIKNMSTVPMTRGCVAFPAISLSFAFGKVLRKVENWYTCSSMLALLELSSKMLYP